MKSRISSMLRIAAVTSLVMASLPNALGQRPRDNNRDRESNERELELRIWNLRMLSEQPRKPEKKRPNAQQALAQIQDDFKRLQILNRDLGRAAIKNEALDLKFVSKSAAEMKKYAQRLNTNLELPEPEPTVEPSPAGLVKSPEQMKPAILKLVRVVYHFVDNPFFKEASVVDTQLATEARRDLEVIITLSEQLKKSGEKWESKRQ